jgi:hypothetical protein
MKMRSYGNAILFAGVFLLLSAMATAQSPAASKKNIPAREASSGHASGRQDQFPKASGAKSLGSAHATESLDSAAASGTAKRGQMGSAQPNPMYKSSGQSGENPLHESKDKTLAPPNTGAPRAVQYKDPEDMTTRYRPGNNKAAPKLSRTQSSGTPAH